MALTNAQSGLIGSSLNAGVGLLNTASQIITNRMDRRAQSEAATTAYNRMIEQWNRENQYNLPKNVMQRYLDAGLNPNLIYGQLGSGLANGAPTVPQADAPNHPAPQLTNLTDAIQNRLTMAQARKLEIESDVMEKKLSPEIDEIYSRIFQNKADAELAQQKVKEVQANVDYIGYMCQDTYQSMRKKFLENFITEQTTQNQIDKIAEEYRITKAQADAAVRYWVSMLLNLDADTYMKNTQGVLNGQLKELNHAITSYKQNENYYMFTDNALGDESIFRDGQAPLFKRIQQGSLDLNRAQTELNDATTANKESERRVLDSQAYYYRRSGDAAMFNTVQGTAQWLIGGVKKGIQMGKGFKGFKPKPKPIHGKDGSILEPLPNGGYKVIRYGTHF